jgi:hypothetical protein
MIKFFIRIFGTLAVILLFVFNRILVFVPTKMVSKCTVT